MEQDVTEEMQAAMALKLADNVKKMIRDEIYNAFNDTAFISTLNTGLLAQVLVQGMRHNTDFKRAVKDVIIEQMNKY